MLLALVAAATSLAAADKAPVVDAAPNPFGQTGVVRTTSAETGSGVDVSASGFLFAQNDFLIPGSTDIFTGGNLALSAAFFDALEVSLATRAATNANSAREPSQFSVGDVFPSLKGAYAFGPVVVGADVRGVLPTRIDRAGLDLANFGVVAQGLVTLDLHKNGGLPLRVNLDGGYAFQNGKFADPKIVKKFEQNPNFYDGVDGQFLALASDQWFYDQVLGGLSVEVPLPYATPYVETWYQGAINVPPNRGVKGKPYDFGKDAHFIITPGARVTIGGGLVADVGVDIGVLGTGAGGRSAAEFVDGTPPLPTYLVRVGLSYTFDPFARTNASSGNAGAAVTGQVKGCVVDDAGRPVPDALVTSPALSGARLATDEAGCFITPPIAPGDVQLTVEKQGFEKIVVAASVDENKIAETTAKLKALGSTAPVVVASKGGTARIVGWVTNKEDETIDAELELWDSSGPKAAGKAVAGAFDLQAQSGSVDVVAKADGYLAQGAALVVEPGAKARTTIVLKKAPKTKKAVLEKDKIAVNAKVPFEFKKPRLQSTAEYVLEDVVDILLRNPNLKVRVDVYAEALPNPDDSQRLADERAAAVVDWLSAHGVWPARLSAKGTPLPANAPDKERRVEFVIVP